MYNLWLAFGGTAQAIPGSGDVGIWYMEGGSQTAIDADKQAAYTGTENVAVVPDFAGGEPDAPPPPETSAAPDQHTQVRDTIRLAACQPYVHAYFNFLLFDEPRLGGWQSGAFWADRTPKGSLPGFRQAIAEANSASVDCSALKGGRPSADFMPPSTPTDLEAVAQQGPLRVELRWSPSTDDLSAVGYRIYRNGAHVGTSSATEWTNMTVTPETTYSYTVRGLDSAGNLGDASVPVTVTTGTSDPPPPPVPPPPLRPTAPAGAAASARAAASSGAAASTGGQVAGRDDKDRHGSPRHSPRHAWARRAARPRRRRPPRRRPRARPAARGDR